MRTLFIFIGLILSVSINAQQNAIDNIFQKFEGKEGITTVNISRDLLQMVSKIDSVDKDLTSVFAMISQVRIIALDKASSEEKVSFKEMLKSLSINDYKTLMLIKENNQDIKFLSKETNGKITEFLLLVSGDKTPVLVSITGNIDLSKLSKLSGKVNLQGFEHLAKLHHKN
jgi:hypothetical protein